ncbi:MAG: hypothetical protein PSV16_00560 [Flavobacterium sp.]|nr:hypothetical protein [Flavobacterium sp.]
MKLVGYIQELKQFSFTIPIYGEGTKYFHHNLDSNMRISGFTEIDRQHSLLEKLYLSTEFSIGSYGAIVFIGQDGYKLFNEARSIINEVVRYLNDTTPINTLRHIKAEAESLKNLLFEKMILQEASDDKNLALLEITKEIGELPVYDPIFLKVTIQNKKEGNKNQKLTIVPMTEIDHERIINYTESEFLRQDRNEIRLDDCEDDEYFKASQKRHAEYRINKLKEYNYKFNVNIVNIKPITNQDDNSDR